MSPRLALITSDRTEDVPGAPLPLRPDQCGRIHRALDRPLPCQANDVCDCLASAPDASVAIELGQVTQGDKSGDRLAGALDDDPFSGGCLIEDPAEAAPNVEG
jgi:hypothetical protein